MPLNRTPPVTPMNEELTGTALRNISQTGSTPNLSTMDSDNITSRFKRKRDDEECDISFKNEIRLLLAASTAKSDAKFADLQVAMREIIAQNTEIKESIAFASRQYDDMVTKIESLELERKADRHHIQQLEERVEGLERLLSSTKIEIRNIPKKQGESKEDLCKFLTENTAKALGMPIQSCDIKDVFRAGKKDDLPIIVDFVSIAKKENIIKRVRKINTKSKLNTTHFGLDTPTKPVYIAEKLTKNTQRTFFLARTYAKNNGFKYCWTSYGQVYLRKDDGQQHIIIRSEADLNNLKDTVEK